MQFSFTLQELADIFGDVKAEGRCDSPVVGIASLREAQPGDLAFLGNMKYRSEVAQTKASYVLLPLDYEGTPPDGQVYLRVARPSLALAYLCRRIEGILWPKPTPGVHPTAVVDASVMVPSDAHIGPYCIVQAGVVLGKNTVLQAQNYVGREVKIGDDCVLMPGAKILDFCVLGNRVRLQPGVVIGSEGFGYETHAGIHEKVPQIGNVVVEDDVEIGANTTIDRARFNETRIGQGTKIDNLVQIAHNVTVGRGCLVCAQVGVSGSTVLEDYVVLGGQVGVVGHMRIGQGTQVGAQSGVNHNLPPNVMVRDTPALPYMVAQRLQVLKGRLPELFKRVSKLEETLEKLSVEPPKRESSPSQP